MPKNLREALQLKKGEGPAVPPRCEWLFRESEVPNDELIACTCWEYLREVPPDNLDSTGFPGYARRLLFSYRSHQARRKFNDSFDRIPLNVLFRLAGKSDTASELLPWQQLDEDFREEMNQSMPTAWKPLIGMDVAAEDLTSWQLKMPDPGQFEVPRPWAALELELYAFGVAHEARRTLPKRPEKSLESITSVTCQAGFAKPIGSINDFSIHDPRSWLIPYASNELARPAPFLINWGEYTVQEIVAAFRDWVEKVRPRFTPIARWKGARVTGLRGALRNLGALRIIKAMPADEFMSRYNDDYRLFQKPWDGKASPKNLPYVDLGKGRRDAVKYFQNYFAKDAGMKPRSWQKPRTKKRKLATPAGELPDFTARRSNRSKDKPSK